MTGHSGPNRRTSSPISMRSLNQRIAASTGIVMASILASRLLGFLREWAVAHQFGSSAVTDAYYTAFTLPDFVNYLVAGGSLSITFIPVFAKYMAEENEEEGWYVFSTVITSMVILLLTLVVVGEFFAPALLHVIAPGFNPAEKAHTVFLTRLMMPAQIFFYLGSILSAVQYAKGRFLISSLAPVVYNVGIILCGFLLASTMGITGFSVGVLIGAFAGNLLLQIYGARGVGARFRPNLDVGHPGFRLFIKLAIPVMLALSVVYSDDWIIRWFGSYLVPASITWLSYAKILMRVPIGVIGQAVGVASFPFLAQLYAEKKYDELNRTFNTTLKGLLLMIVPVSALTIAMNRPLVYFVFSHTRLRTPDLNATAAALALFSISMFAWGAQGILARGFYAGRDTLRPAVFGTAITFLNLPVYWLLVRPMQFKGLALASSIGISVYTVVLFVSLYRSTANKATLEMVGFFLRIIAASTVGGVGAFEIVHWLEGMTNWHNTSGALIVLIVATPVGLALTAFSAKLLRIHEMDHYLKSIPSFSRMRRSLG
ncbi:MAG: murein biosynthesis integral membrane protein MurJ [Acidobacteria bacterium]|nr:MAG: murein biosynthesis integral membrane protein MurJ [Acidobacteriota bacterium]